MGILFSSAALCAAISIPYARPLIIQILGWDLASSETILKQVFLPYSVAFLVPTMPRYLCLLKSPTPLL